MRLSSARRADSRSCDLRTGRAGFSLIEMVLGISLFVALSAVAIPALIVQIQKGNIGALATELGAIKSGVERFHADVARYPSELNQLIYDPADGTSVENSGTVDNLGFWADNSGTKKSFPPGREKHWDGPYLDLGFVPTDGAPTLFNATIERDFVMVCSNGARYLAVHLTGMTQADATELNLFIDKDSDLGPVRIFNDGTDSYDQQVSPDGGSEEEAGLIRWWDAGGGNTSLVYLLIAVGTPKCT